MFTYVTFFVHSSACFISTSLYLAQHVLSSLLTNLMFVQNMFCSLLHAYSSFITCFSRFAQTYALLNLHKPILCLVSILITLHKPKVRLASALLALHKPIVCLASVLLALHKPIVYHVFCLLCTKLQFVQQVLCSLCTNQYFVQHVLCSLCTNVQSCLARALLASRKANFFEHVLFQRKPGFCLAHTLLSRYMAIV